MHDIHGDADYLQLVFHNDELTPRDFVVGLFRSVFTWPTSDAVAVAAMIERQGKVVCGPYPRAVAEALLQTAQRRIRASGHPMLITTEAGHDLGRDECKLCGGFDAQNNIRLAGKTMVILPARLT